MAEYKIIYNAIPCSLFYDGKEFFGAKSWRLITFMEETSGKRLKDSGFEPFDRGIWHKNILVEEAFDLILSAMTENKRNLVKLLKPPLLDILKEELSLGNEIVEVFADQRLYIFLGQPFLSPVRTDLENVIYTEVNDPHYWKSEYYNQKTWQVLACKYT